MSAEALKGSILLQVVAERIIARYLRHEGMVDVSAVSLSRRNGHGDGVDMTYSRMGRVTRVKVKADPYFGSDSKKTRDLSLPYCRPDSGEYALEVVAHHLTRQPGWMFRSDADELFYYLIALDHTEEEVAALVREADEVFFSEIRVLRDALHVMPMMAVRAWFAEHQEEFLSRPVEVGGHSAWYRIVPRAELDHAIQGIVKIGPIFGI